MLYLVATPIGNLKEITYRAVEILKSVEYIACEDTRTSLVLLNNLDIHKPLKSYHKFNEKKMGLEIINDLKNGKDIAIISDAGTPGISDPGNVIVNMCIKDNIPYTLISGPSALINAFVLSGYETPFTFVGFLPDNNTDREKLLEELKSYKSTLIFYCSPYSLIKDIGDMYRVLGDREYAAIREISKKFEEVNFGKLSTGYTGTLKGEFVVVVKKSVFIDNNSRDIDKDLQILIDMGLSKTEASKVIAKSRGLKKSDIYNNMFK